MQYITGIHALNLNCSLDTAGDWHRSWLQWDHPKMGDTEEAFFRDYGIENCNHVPGREGTQKVANHIRALLDLLVEGNFSTAQGMKNDFIVNDKYTPEIFRKVYELHDFKTWPSISHFMGKEYGIEWLKFLASV